MLDKNTRSVYYTNVHETWTNGGEKLDKEAIAKKLIELRGENSREYVAKALGISVSALSMYENGDRVPRDDIKIKIAKFYNSTVEAIFFASKVHGA